MEMNKFLDKMWKQYVELNPDALKIHQLLEDKNDHVLNDHVAYRTIKHPKLGIKSLAKHFEKYGYVEKSDYHFELKKLYAIHMEHKEDPSLPKIFISELLLEKFSESLQSTLNQVIEQIPIELIKDVALCTAGRVWKSKHSTYLELYKESEYAAWFYVYGFCANHFTVNLNELSSFKEVSDLNTFLIENGFAMNESGGLVKGSEKEMLEQSSTMAYNKKVKLEDGVFELPSCYYEFAKRYKDQSGRLYQGFVAKSADKIFESTNKR